MRPARNGSRYLSLVESDVGVNNEAKKKGHFPDFKRRIREVSLYRKK
jgi:hypothetical protein